MTKREITELDNLFRGIIRARDRVCQKCGKNRNLQVAHIISRSNKHVRWTLDNCVLLCAGCHIFGFAHRDPLEFAEWVLGRLGTNKYLMLKRMARDTSKLYFDDIYFRLKLEQQKYID